MFTIIGYSIVFILVKYCDSIIYTNENFLLRTFIWFSKCYYYGFSYSSARSYNNCNFVCYL